MRNDNLRKLKMPPQRLSLFLCSFVFLIGYTSCKKDTTGTDNQNVNTSQAIPKNNSDSLKVPKEVRDFIRYMDNVPREKAKEEIAKFEAAHPEWFPKTKAKPRPKSNSNGLAAANAYGVSEDEFFEGQYCNDFLYSYRMDWANEAPQCVDIASYYYNGNPQGYILKKYLWIMYSNPNYIWWITSAEEMLIDQAQYRFFLANHEKSYLEGATSAVPGCSVEYKEDWGLVFTGTTTAWAHVSGLLEMITYKYRRPYNVPGAKTIDIGEVIY